jgi:hypothetical protein
MQASRVMPLTSIGMAMGLRVSHTEADDPRIARRRYCSSRTDIHLHPGQGLGWRWSSMVR